MACTSKIHSIINKPYEDGFFYEYDHDLVMTAGNEELLNDNELNTSDRIYVSTHYDGGLAEERIIINDSPGVNFSGDSEHKLISNELIKGRKYNLLIYVMNSTQLATNDEDEHLEFIKSTIGRTPAIFIMNKIDSYNLEEEDVIATIGRQIEYLKKKGFKNPIVCPVSARAGYLAKQFTSTKLSKSEERELYNYVDKFEQMKLSDYYEEYFPNIVIEDKEQEEQLLKTCGLAYVEQIIKKCISGGR
jgi:GTPase Era involved in 16S rRNA processing